MRTVAVSQSAQRTQSSTVAILCNQMSTMCLFNLPRKILSWLLLRKWTEVLRDASFATFVLDWCPSWLLKFLWEVTCSWIQAVISDSLKQILSLPVRLGVCARVMLLHMHGLCMGRDIRVGRRSFLPPPLPVCLIQGEAVATHHCTGG